jgi:hypothetical protein
MNNHKKCVLLLLDNGGNPFICDKNGRKPENVTTDTDIRILLQTTTEQPFNFIYQNDNNRKKSNNKKKSRYTLKQNNINQK